MLLSLTSVRHSTWLMSTSLYTDFQSWESQEWSLSGFGATQWTYLNGSCLMVMSLIPLPVNTGVSQGSTLAVAHKNS